MAQGISDAGSTAGGRERELPLFRVIDGVREAEGSIVARVEARRARLEAGSGLAGLALARAVAQDLVDEAALRSALIGAGGALPLTIPFVGFWASILITVGGSALLQLANEVDLVYAVAAAYRTRLASDRLRMVAFWLVQLSNYEDLQAKALTIGTRVTVRKLVEKLIAVGLSRALAATAPAMMGTMMGRAAQAAPAPWYVRATGLLGVPVIACFGWRSAEATGRRAVAYFEEELGEAASPPPGLR